MRKAMNNFSFITFDPTIEPNKQRLELNNLASIQREKLKGAHAIQEPTIFTNLDPKCKPLQKLITLLIYPYNSNHNTSFYDKLWYYSNRYQK
jgi:hypothetical protein